MFFMKGSEKVEIISVNLYEGRRNMCMKADFFDKMTDLRVFDLHHKMTDIRYSDDRCIIQVPEGLSSLPSKLISYLCWDKFPLTSFPREFSHADHLVELQLSDSHLEQLWSEGAEPHLPLLERMNLSESKDLIKLPNLSKCPNLKTLDVGCCGALVEVPSSIQHLSKLQTLNMGWCENLAKLPVLPQSIVSLKLFGTNFEELPSWIGSLSQLQTLNLAYCIYLTSLPESLGSIQSLKDLDMYNSGIESLPTSIKHLSQLEELNLDECKNLKSLPDLPSSLKELYASGCTSLRIEGDIFGSSLSQLYLDISGVESLPSIKHLSQLEELHLEECKNLKSLPDLPSSLEVLHATGCTSLRIEGDIFGSSSLWILYLGKTGVESLPASIKHLSQLKHLYLEECKNLKSLPDLPSSLEVLYAEGCTSLRIEGDIFGSSLRELYLGKTGVESLPASIKHLSQLDYLHLEECKNLKSLPDLPSSLMELDASGCTSLRIEGDIFGSSSLRNLYLGRSGVESLPSIKHLSQLEELHLQECKNLKSLPNLPSSLVVLHATGCTSLRIEGDIFGSSLSQLYLGRSGVESLPASITHLSQLRVLHLEECKNLKSLPDLPSSLERLDASGCTSLRIEGDIFGSSSLWKLYLGKTGVESLPTSIKHLSQLKYLYLQECKNLKSLRDLPSSLKVLCARGCTSLTTVGNIFGEYDETFFKIDMVGCFNLDQNSRIICLAIVQARLNAHGYDSLLLLGSEVPNWFKYKAEGSLIEVEVLGGMLLEPLNKFAFCVVIDDSSNIMEISSGSLQLDASCKCMFVSEFGEHVFYSSSCFYIHHTGAKSKHVLLWAEPLEATHSSNQIISSPRMMCSKAKFDFSSKCNIMHCGVSFSRNWETGWERDAKANMRKRKAEANLTEERDLKSALSWKVFSASERAEEQSWREA